MKTETEVIEFTMELITSEYKTYLTDLELYNILKNDFNIICELEDVVNLRTTQVQTSIKESNLISERYYIRDLDLSY